MTSINPRTLVKNGTTQEIESAVVHYDRQYWLGKPEISDELFDALIDRLPKSSTVRQRVGPVRDAKNVFCLEAVHQHPMQSLEKAKNPEQVAKWVKGFRKTQNFLVTPKIDGMAASLHYDENGVLFLAATRGDGEKGENITASVLRQRNIPRLTFYRNVEVRGEIYMPKEDFAEMSDVYTSSRNAVAGILRDKHASKPITCLKFFPYDIIGKERNNSTLTALCLDIVPEEVKFYRMATSSDLEDVYQDLMSDRQRYPFEADGVVIRLDSEDDFRAAGRTSHHPKGAIALKFTDEVAETTVLDIEWSVSRAGTITPIVEIRPVKLASAVISKASLFHAGMVQKLGLRQGSIVSLTRRGGIIPHIEEVLVEGLGKEFKIPDKCPGCEKKVRRSAKSGDIIRISCPEPDSCTFCMAASVVYFAATIGLKGYGHALADEMAGSGFITEARDLWNIPQILATAPILSKTANKLRKIYADVKLLDKAPLIKVLQAAGIECLGPATARLLLTSYPTWEKLSEAIEKPAAFQNLSQIRGIGQEKAQSIVVEMRKRMAELRELVRLINPSIEGAPKEEGKLSGKSFVFTGALKTMSREDAARAVRAHGGSVAGQITKRTSYLVQGGPQETKTLSEKARTAMTHDIPVLFESAFRKMVC